MEITPDIKDRIEQLSRKFDASGQDLLAYLDGLLYSDYIAYWDYLQLDTLLTLQKPRTPIKDEMIFILYHQITELYFKLSRHALQQLIDETGDEIPDLDLFKRQVGRVNSYFNTLAESFDVMVSGMDKEEFLKFRMALLPASGFQSGQYRMIEMMSTDLRLLVHQRDRSKLEDGMPLEGIFPHLYWKSGGIEVRTGSKTLTLRQFEKKYTPEFVRLAKRMRRHNLRQLYLRLPEAQRDDELRNLLREYDLNTSVRWRLAHYRSAVKHLHKDPQDVAATGGTNWMQYLPPKQQRIVFFPDLWDEVEMEQWGTKTK